MPDLHAAERAVTRRLRYLVLEDPRSVALGNEPVGVDGEVAREPLYDPSGEKLRG